MLTADQQSGETAGRVFSRTEPRHKQDIVRLLKEMVPPPPPPPFPTNQQQRCPWQIACCIARCLGASQCAGDYSGVFSALSRGGAEVSPGVLRCAGRSRCDDRRWGQ